MKVAQIVSHQRLPIPLHRDSESVAEWHDWAVAQRLPDLAQVGQRMLDVSGSLGAVCRRQVRPAQQLGHGDGQFGDGHALRRRQH